MTLAHNMIQCVISIWNRWDDINDIKVLHFVTAMAYSYLTQWETARQGWEIEMSEFICDCGDQHRDNPFCYDRHLKYNRRIRGDIGVIEAAVAEGVITQDDADSMLVTAKLSRAGRMTMLHRSIFHSYLDRLDPVIERLREIGYAV